MIKIEYLADVPEYTPIIAYWCHKQWWLGENRRPFAESVEVFNNRLNKDQLPLTIVAFVDGIPVGTVSLVSDDHLTECVTLSPWVAALYVIPEYRNHGIAKELLNSISQSLSNMGVRSVYLHSANASLYYLKLGWHVTKRNVIGPWGETTILQKEICV